MPTSTESRHPKLPPPLASPRNLGIVGLVAGTFVLLLVLTFSGIYALSAIRGYVLGEGLWSKAQKRSVVALQRYARTGSQADWVAYDDAIAVTLGDRRAREELERPDPDMDVVSEGFSQGGIPEELHSGMAVLFRRARRVDFVDRAIGIWTEADGRIERLQELAEALRDERESANPESTRLGAILASVNDVDEELTLLEEAFTATLNQGAYQVQSMLRWVLLAIAVIVAIGAWLALRLLYRQVRLREEVLERSEARYRVLFEESVVGTVLSSGDGVVLRANAAFADMLGYDSAQELEGLPATRLYLNPEDRVGIVENLRAKGAVLMDELLARRKDGSPAWLMTNSVVLEDPADGSEQVLATCLDITERKEMEERLARKSRIEAMGQLAGGLAHDFNNLLTAIKGNASLLGAELPSDPGVEDAREILSEVVASADGAAQLTEQLLAFSRGDPSSASPVDLGKLVMRTRSLLGRLLPESIELVTEITDRTTVVEAPPAQLEQVLLNLVLNARDAMADGGLLTVAVDRKTIRAGDEDGVVALPPGEYVWLRVSDEGHGIPPELRERLFEPFFTTKADRGGTGMGLATVYGVVTRAGGSIRVESNAAAGATFHVLLPSSGRAEPAPDPRGIKNGKGASETILLVEDEDAVRRVARRILENAGYRVIEAPDGTRALEILDAEEPFDLLLTDVVMPGLSGPDLAREAVSRRPELPVLFVSGYTNVALGGEGLEEATTDSLAKPFSPTGLVERVQALLGR